MIFSSAGTTTSLGAPGRGAAGGAEIAFVGNVVSDFAGPASGLDISALDFIAEKWDNEDSTIEGTSSMVTKFKSYGPSDVRIKVDKITQPDTYCFPVWN